jgi:carbonic anhydrase
MQFLKISLFVLFTTTVAAAPLAVTSETVESYQKRQDTATPTAVINWLLDGNKRFARGSANQGGFKSDPRLRRYNSAQGQRPLAVVLSCIDSRTTPELVFDVSVGDLFTARVGANVINDDVLGSIEVAVESGAKVVVVMGHTRCGGIAAACSGLQLGYFTQLLDRIQPVIKDVNSALDADPIHSAEVGERVSTNPKYIREVSHANARNSFRMILEKSSIISDKVNRGEIKLVSALYDVDSGRVLFDK